MELINILPNLSIGVISILSLVWVTKQFIEHLREEKISERLERKENEIAFRSIEKEVREKIMSQLNENTRMFEKVFEHINKH